MRLTVGSLFAGIGGFDLGLERAGFEVRWQVEIDPFCRAVLEKHWPHVRRYEDVRTVGSELERVDVICGGFPCQDISVAGAGAGIDGERSGLWREYLRLIRELRPRYVIVENVAALLARGLGRVLGDLAASGFDAEWDCLPASAFGAPHRRDRVWVIAYAGRECAQQPQRERGRRLQTVSANNGAARYVADPDDCGELQPQGREQVERRWIGDSGEAVADANRKSIFGASIARGERHPWEFEPDVGRVAHGVPARVDRLRGLGNAIVPQIAQWLGERILEAEGEVAHD